MLSKNILSNTINKTSKQTPLRSSFLGALSNQQNNTQNFKPQIQQVNKRTYAEKKKKKEIENGMDFIPDRYVRTMPAELSEPVTSKKLSLTICTNNSYLSRGERVDEIKLYTIDQGEVTILPNHRTHVYRMAPGLVTIKYSDEKSVKWYTSGGMVFIFYHGYIQLNFAEAFKLEDLDLNLARRELEAQRELLKSRDFVTKGQAEIAVEFLEPLVSVLEEAEFEV